MAEAAVQVLARAAARLGRAARTRNPRGRNLPSLYFLTDPTRTPDPARVMAALPPGSAVIYRAFGAPDAEAEGRALRRLARARRLVFLVGADAGLAARLRADGVHLPERLMARAPRLRQAHPGWLITTAAHGPRAVAAAARRRLHAALVSTVFASDSPSAGRPLGPLRFAQRARQARLPVIALGGVDARTARRLADSGAAGLAAIGGLI
ncbi:MAG TPA: thiamine phosphate synthase [Caulobacteraceae bacterium]|nr:thiamine phosphate synthase [Caulobacteraceae bacterium]